MPDALFVDDEYGGANVFFPPADATPTSMAALMVTLAADQWGETIEVESTPKLWHYRDDPDDEEKVIIVEPDHPEAKPAWFAWIDYQERTAASTPQQGHDPAQERSDDA